jgi:membrane-associated protease RseP (regulator of RpoE activity)
MVKPGSPAQHAKIQPGDTILSFNGQPMQDFTKITLATALASTDEPLRVNIERYGTKALETVDVQPVRQAGSSKSFLALGIGAAPSLQGINRKDYPEQIDENLLPPATYALKPDDVITKVNGVDVGLYDYAKLDRAIQDSHGQPIALTVRRKDGKVETVQLKPHFDTLFGTQQNDLNIAGLQPRMRVEQILDKNSPAYKKLMPGDAVVRLGVRNASTPSTQPAVLVAQVSVPASATAWRRRSRRLSRRSRSKIITSWASRRPSTMSTRWWGASWRRAPRPMRLMEYRRARSSRPWTASQCATGLISAMR